MDISLKDLFSNSFVISINKERYNRFNRIFLKTHKGLPLPKLYYGVTNLKTSVDCCKQSHLNVITKAKELDLPYVLVFEDDAYPCEHITDRFQNLIDALDDNADFVYVGYSNILFCRGLKITIPKSHLLFNPNKCDVFSISGFQSYIVFKKGYDKFLDFFKNNKQSLEIDNYTFRISDDTYCVRDSLYIQYNCENTLHWGSGYQFFNFDKQQQRNTQNPPDGFQKIEGIL